MSGNHVAAGSSRRTTASPLSLALITPVSLDSILPAFPIELVSQPTKALVANPFVLVVGRPALPFDIRIFRSITPHQEGRRAECAVVMVPIGLPQEIVSAVKSSAHEIGAAIFEIEVGKPL